MTQQQYPVSSVSPHPVGRCRLPPPGAPAVARLHQLCAPLPQYRILVMSVCACSLAEAWDMPPVTAVRVGAFLAWLSAQPHVPGLHRGMVPHAREARPRSRATGLSAHPGAFELVGPVRTRSLAPR